MEPGDEEGAPGPAGGDGIRAPGVVITNLVVGRVRRETAGEEDAAEDDRSGLRLDEHLMARVLRSVGVDDDFHGGRHAVGRVIARPFVGDPGNYTRTPNRHDWSLKPRQPNYLTLVREAGREVHGVGKIHDIFAGVDIDHSHPTKSNIEGIQQTESLLRELEDGFVFVNLVETDMLWGHRNDPLNFHRCLQDFDRRLPDLLEALRPNDLFILTSDHGCDPTTPSTDHSREHALLLAYVEGRNEDGGTHEGEFADVGATVNAWLGGKTPGRGIPGAPLLEQT